MLSFLGLGGLRPSEPAPWRSQIRFIFTLHDTDLNTLSTQTPRGQKWHGYIYEEWQIKMMAVFFYIAREKGFEFYAQPQTGAYSCLTRLYSDLSSCH